MNIKRVIASAGAVAVGTAGLQGQNVTGLTAQQQAKRWIVSASLRSFYDDNSLNQIDTLAKASFGFELHPGISFNLPLDQTLFTASYDFTLNYYEARPDSNFDQDHSLAARLSHKFSERSEIDASYNFLYSDQPEVTRQSGSGGLASAVFSRTDNSRIQSNIAFDYFFRLMPRFGLVAGYKNYVTDYFETADPGANQPPSLSALLDQIQHAFHIDGQWFATRSTIFLASYQFAYADYTSKELLGFRDFLEVYPDQRNTYSHYIYAGFKHEISRRLTSNLSAGARYTDFYKENESTLSPFVDLRATYTYLPESTAQLGVNMDRVPVDTGVDENQLTLDGFGIGVNASINHQITSRIQGLLGLSYQNTRYNGGQFNKLSTDYISLNSQLEYKLREYVFLSLGYVRYDYSSKARGNDFTRNRVYLGVRATY